MAGASKSEQMESEEAAVRAAFPGGCRIVKTKDDDPYPTVVPEISVRSVSITEEGVAELCSYLKSKAASLVGQDMVLALTADATKKLHDMGLRPGKSKRVEGHSFIEKKNPKKKKPRRKPKSEDEKDEFEKLPSMKTSDDVVKRILWDDNLEKDDFVIGYIDRFKGLVEKCFSAFSWEDLATVDYDVLAIPKHRIQYFSYKGVKVWDKPRRMDNVFGSASGTKTIDVVMKELEEIKHNAEETFTNNKSDEYSDDDDESDSSDSDDGITVSIGDSASNISPSLHDGNDPYWMDKLRPNYFFCVRITDPGIRDKVSSIQDHLMTSEPALGECCIPLAALHLTLCTVGLDTAEQLADCILALKRLQPELKEALPTSKLNINGVDTFYNRVLYAKVEAKKDFYDFHSLLKTQLSQNGVQVRDGYQFVPHITIMKTTRPVSRLRGSKNISPALYQNFTNLHLGEQNIDSVYLCSMENERRDDGFYLTPSEIHFDCLNKE